MLDGGLRSVFYERLNAVLAEIDFKRLEEAAAPDYETTERNSVVPRLTFRRLYIGYFGGIDSERTIA